MNYIINLKKLLILIFFFFSTISNSQEICGLTKFKKNIIQCLQNDSRLENNIITRITKKAGIYSDFVLKDCSNIQNAVALIYKNERILLFDFDFFGRLYNNNKMSAIFILAHEIGHHVNSHTSISSSNFYDSQKKELEADIFAGYIMYRIG